MGSHDMFFDGTRDVDIFGGLPYFRKGLISKYGTNFCGKNQPPKIKD